MERARYNTELYSNPGPLLNNVKPSNFWGSHHISVGIYYLIYLVMMFFAMLANTNPAAAPISAPARMSPR